MCFKKVARHWGEGLNSDGVARRQSRPTPPRLWTMPQLAAVRVVGNDLAPVATSAHLLLHGPFPGEVTFVSDSISVGNGKIKVTAVKNPAQLPWKELDVEIALECTGIFVSKDKAAAHLTAGADRVIISAPAEGVDLTVVMASTTTTCAGTTRSSPTRLALRIVSRLLPKCSMTQWGSTRAS